MDRLDRDTKRSHGASSLQAYDNEREGLIVLLGTLAIYVEDDGKVQTIVARLVEALSTPSQKVTDLF